MVARPSVKNRVGARGKVDIREAADLLSVSPITVRRWIASGALRAERVGPKLLRIRIEDLEALGRPVA